MHLAILVTFSNTLQQTLEVWLCPNVGSRLGFARHAGFNPVYNDVYPCISLGLHPEFRLNLLHQRAQRGDFFGESRDIGFQRGDFA